MDSTVTMVEDSMRMEEASHEITSTPDEEKPDEKPDITKLEDESDEIDEKPDIENISDNTSKETTPTKPERKLISLRVTSQEGIEFSFKVSTGIRMEKIMKSYNERVETPSGTLRFLYNGTRLKGTDTPESLGMEEEDHPEIDVVADQTGGGIVLLYC